MIGKNVLSVLSIFAAVVLVLILLAAFAIAKTGLVTIPVFSRLYHGPAPTRVVRTQPIEANAFRVLVSGRLLAQTNQGELPPYEIRLSEAELTGALLGAIPQALRDERWKIEHAQLVVTPSYVEANGRLVSRALRADLRARFLPVIEKGGLRLVPVDIRFGDYPIHPDLAYRLAGLLFSRDFGTWILTFGDTRLESVRLEDASLELSASPVRP
ncbi:MAG: hypothetical protein WC787_00970 [Patescibacteria group bacterium]|jgi:hypothetical protein